jgi:hypothetical protein
MPLARFIQEQHNKPVARKQISTWVSYRIERAYAMGKKKYSTLTPLVPNIRWNHGMYEKKLQARR